MSSTASERPGDELTRTVNERILNNMSRPSSIANDQILDAARAVFLEKGFAAPTAEIARRAGVSEGSLFNRFSTKEELFFAAIGIPTEIPWFATIDRMIELEFNSAASLKVSLVDLYVEIIEHFRQILPRITMFWASRVHPPSEFPRLDEPPPVKIQKKLEELFAREIERGRIRSCKPDLAAAIYMGGIHHVVMVEMIAHKKPTSARRYAEDMMDLLWRAFAPEDAS